MRAWEGGASAVGYLDCRTPSGERRGEPGCARQPGAWFRSTSAIHVAYSDSLFVFSLFPYLSWNFFDCACWSFSAEFIEYDLGCTIWVAGPKLRWGLSWSVASLLLAVRPTHSGPPHLLHSNEDGSSSGSDARPPVPRLSMAEILCVSDEENDTAARPRRGGSPRTLAGGVSVSRSGRALSPD